MNFHDLLHLDIGDSIIGLGGRWDDELPVVDVGPLRRQQSGRVVRSVVARCGTGQVKGFVGAGDETIRGSRTWWAR